MSPSSPTNGLKERSLDDLVDISFLELGLIAPAFLARRIRAGNGGAVWRHRAPTELARSLRVSIEDERKAKYPVEALLIECDETAPYSSSIY